MTINWVRLEFLTNLVSFQNIVLLYIFYLFAYRFSAPTTSEIGEPAGFGKHCVYCATFFTQSNFSLCQIKCNGQLVTSKRTS